MTKEEILKELIIKELIIKGIIKEGNTQFVARRSDGTEVFELVELIHYFSLLQPFNFIDEEVKKKFKEFNDYLMGKQLQPEQREVKICSGCGTLSTDILPANFLGCCPDNNYIDIKQYFRDSKYLK